MHRKPLQSAQLNHQPSRQGEERAQQPCYKALQDARLTNSETLPHHEPEIEASYVD